MILRFHHGWGFDSSLWRRVVPLLEGFECRIDDRGYFAAPVVANAGELAVCHSFGTMRALAAPRALRGLVAIGGFDCFTARPGFPGVPPRLVDRMLTRFAAAPEAVVADFRQRCGAAHTPPLRDPAALRADLAALREADLRGAATVPVIALHAADDPVVPPPLQAAALAGAERITLPSGGHLLPLTAPEACAAAIRRAAGQLA